MSAVSHSLRALTKCLAQLPFAVALGLPLFACTTVAAQDQTFTAKVAPLLQQHCISCHGPDAQESGLRLDSLQALNTGGKAGPPIIPGKPDESLLVVALRRTDSTLQMPPEGKLPDDAIAAIEQWISQGALHPDGAVVPAQPVLPFVPEQARQFWAFKPLETRPIESPAETSPIDALTASLLQKQGFQRNPPADKLTLIRRASLMLTGLPPAPEEIDAFLADHSPAAFATVVDRLLDSQQYGEHWGRHWLDVVRYADSNGLDENIAHGNAWRYRNYVIRSIQTDKPFDQFLREQLAGDLLTDSTSDEQTRIDQLIATGFLALGPKVLAEGDEKKLMLDIIDEQLDTIGRSMLGLTIGCARCHDHKFDPLTQADYYSLAGIFQSTKTMESLKRIAKWHENTVATTSDRQKLEQHTAQIAAKKTEIDSLIQQASAAAGSAGQPIPEDQLPQQIQQQLASLRASLKELEAAIPELPTAMGVTDTEAANARILPRGNHLAPGRLVPRTIPVVLNTDNSFQIPDGHSGRLEFANWITSTANPLTPRVIVNRVWRWHFGRGLVATADNFGHQAEPPVNPQLLDWLAADFVNNGWSLKSLHRRILLSKTWQATADRSNPAEQADPDNHLQWRWSVQRLEAESVRDSILAVCGKLDRSMGESMLHVKNREFLFDHTSKDLTSYDSFRRSVYLPVIRNNLYDAMSLFDCTDGTVPNGDRGASTIASQALFLMNSPLVIAAAEHLAQDLCSSSSDFTARAARLSRTVLGRQLTSAELLELQHAATALQAQLQADGIPAAGQGPAVWTSLCQTLLMSNEFLYIR
ncbi:MAG: PSD1 and planctomycete cytochrome C domain-containing protein [Planctomycetaceae bacterium]